MRVCHLLLEKQNREVKILEMRTNIKPKVKIAYDHFKLDQLQILEDSRCCLKVNAVITKEGVYQYPDGRALKSRMELLKATPTARAAKLTVHDHPDSLVVMSQNQMKGVVEKPYFDRDKIRAVLSFDKAVCSRQFLDQVRNQQLKDVSIGFYYQPDLTSGVWNGQPYDYVMRDILIDHVAAGVPKGRCSYPSCGIGVDAMMRRIALDPFGPYASFADCVAKNSDKKDAQAWCASLEHKLTGKWPAEDNHKLIGGIKTKKTEKDIPGDGDGPREHWYPWRLEKFNECVAQRMSEGANADPPMTREQAEALCEAATQPEDEPGPVPEHLDSKDLSKWQRTVKTYMDKGACAKDSIALAKADGITKTDEDAAFEHCVSRKMEDGKSREEAEKECRAEHPVAEEDQEGEEAEATPLERCVKDRIEAEGESEEEATSWCKAELAGEHEAADSMIDRSKKLIEMRTKRDIERRRHNRQHPL